MPDGVLYSSYGCVFILDYCFHYHWIDLFMRTWIWEMIVAAVILFAVALYQAEMIHFISAAAVLFTFGHMQIANRLEEAESKKSIPEIECYYKLNRYLWAREILWVITFLLLNNWPALIGCALFLLYPLWRKTYRKYYPKS